MTAPDRSAPGNPGWAGHSGPDQAAARAFYADALGLAIAELPMQDGSSHAAIMVGDYPVGGFSPMPEDSGAWTVFFSVPDVDATVTRVEKAGGQILSPAMDMPGVGRMATLADPQGARFAVITYEDQPA